MKRTARLQKIFWFSCFIATFFLSGGNKESYGFGALFRRETVPPPPPPTVWPSGSCGTSGNVEERALSCNQRYYARKKGTTEQRAWSLVSRFGSHPVVFRDPTKENLWTNVLSRPMSLKEAEAACQKPERETDAKGGVELAASLLWSLPRVEDFEQAIGDGMMEALPGSTDPWSFDWFATSTKPPLGEWSLPESEMVSIHRKTGKASIRDVDDSTLSLVRCISISRPNPNSGSNANDEKPEATDSHQP
jgi:hypothetical protein